MGPYFGRLSDFSAVVAPAIFRILYILSDFFYLLIYHVVGYRRKVVYQNLKNAFPELNESQRKAIEKKFYHHLCDVFLETTKLVSFTESELKKRVKIKHSDRFYELITLVFLKV